VEPQFSPLIELGGAGGERGGRREKNRFYEKNFAAERSLSQREPSKRALKL
jgi:hypothetical protein